MFCKWCVAQSAATWSTDKATGRHAAEHVPGCPECRAPITRVPEEVRLFAVLNSINEVAPPPTTVYSIT